MILREIGQNLRINLKAREWCRLPYPNHSHGCPNYGRKTSCPPQAPLISDYFDLGEPMYLIAVEFNLADHIQSMKTKHPDWTDRQCRCVLYWQAKVNKELRMQCFLFKLLNPNMITTTCPEAMGVNIIATARRCGIPIELKPQNKVYKIALAGNKQV